MLYLQHYIYINTQLVHGDIRVIMEYGILPTSMEILVIIYEVYIFLYDYLAFAYL